MSKEDDNKVVSLTGRVETHEPTIGDNRKHPIFEKVVITEADETLWKITLAGAGEINLTSEEVLQQGVFIRRCHAKFHFAYARMKQDKWTDLINRAAISAEVVPANEDTSVIGQFRSALSEFLTDRARGTRREDVWGNRPWEDEEHKDGPRHWFKLIALERFLKREYGERYRYMKSGKLGSLIRDKLIGGDDGSLRTSQGSLWAWWVPSSALVKRPGAIEPEKIELKERDI